MHVQPLETFESDLNSVLPKLSSELRTFFLGRLLQKYCWEHNRLYVEKLIALGAECDGNFEWLEQDISTLNEHSVVKDWSKYFIDACKTGQLSLVELVLSKMKKSRLEICAGMNIACANGNIDIAEMILDRAHQYLSWSDIIYWACRGGHLPLIEFAIAKLIDAKLESRDSARAFDSGIYGACFNGDPRIIELLTTHAHACADIRKMTFEWACFYGQMGLASANANAEPRIEDTWKDGLKHACRGNQIDTAKAIITKLEQPLDIELLSACLFTAASGGAYKTIDLMIQMGANNFNESREVAAFYGHDEASLLMELAMHIPPETDRKTITIRSIIDQTYKDSTDKYQIAMYQAYCSGQLDVDMLLRGYKMDDPLKYACEHELIDLLKVLLNA